MEKGPCPTVLICIARYDTSRQTNFVCLACSFKPPKETFGDTKYIFYNVNSFPDDFPLHDQARRDYLHKSDKIAEAVFCTSLYDEQTVESVIAHLSLNYFANQMNFFQITASTNLSGWCIFSFLAL